MTLDNTAKDMASEREKKNAAKDFTFNSLQVVTVNFLFTKHILELE